MDEDECGPACDAVDATAIDAAVGSAEVDEGADMALRRSRRRADAAAAPDCVPRRVKKAVVN